MQFNLLKTFTLATLLVGRRAKPDFGTIRLGLRLCHGYRQFPGDIGGDNLTRQDFAADLHLNATKVSSQVFVRYRVTLSCGQSTVGNRVSRRR